MDERYLDALRDWPTWAPPLGVLLTTLIVGFIARRVLFRILHRWSSATSVALDDVVVGALRPPFMIWVLILAIHLATSSSRLPVRLASSISTLLLVLWIISLTVVLSRAAVGLIKHYGRQVQGAVQVTSLTENLARLLIGILGVLAILGLLGIDIAAYLAALGVGGLAVALALQDTLSNLFAGFYISVAGQVRVSDYVKLDSGEEGYVTDIGWRSTTIRALANNLIIIPNSKLGQANVTNFHLPEKRMSLLIPVGVSYDCDPEHVERVLIEEAKAAAGIVPGLLAEPAPFVRFIPGFGDSSLNFTLITQVGEFVDQYLVQHELRKRIFVRFRSEGIEIPFPIRTVYMRTPNQMPSTAAMPAPDSEGE